MYFTEEELTAMDAELAAHRERGHKLIMLVGEIIAFDRIKRLHSPQLLK